MSGVGLVRRPCENVSEASKKLKSSGTKGSGTWHQGRIARRSSKPARATKITAATLLRASFVNVRSICEKTEAPSRGKANAKPMAMVVRPPSINVRVTAWSAGADDNMCMQILCHSQNKEAVEALRKDGRGIRLSQALTTG